MKLRCTNGHESITRESKPKGDRAIATIGQINTVISVTTAPLTSGLASAGTAIKGLVTKIAPLAAAFTGVAGAAGMGFLIKRSFDTIDSLAKTADSVGLTTEALAGLRRAGERSGVETGKLDKAIARMQRTVSTANDSLVETERGTSGAAKNFEKLGLSVDHIRSLAPEEQFFQIADAINQIPDQTDKTRLAMETFGRDGISILKILGKGADAAREELAKAAELGLAPSREDAARIEEANDAMADMKDSFIGIANSMAITLAPAIKTMSERVTRFGIMARGAFEKVMPVIKQFGNLVGAIFSRVGEVASTVFGMFADTGKSTFETVRDFAFDAFAVIEFGIQNVGPIAELLWTKIQLGAVGFWENTKHLFTKQIPGVLTWFSDNWRDIFATVFDYTTTVFINLGKNIRNAMGAIWKFIKSGGKSGLQFAWEPLTEGFKNTIKELPDIPERALTELEKTLGDRAKDLGETLSEGLGEHLAMRRAELMGDQPLADTKTMLDFTDDAAGRIASSVKDLEGPAAVERGSAEAFSAIFKAMRGESEQDKQLKAAEQQLKEQKQQTAALKKIASNPPVQLVAGEV